MTTTLHGVTARKKPSPSAEEQAAKELVRLAREQGLSLTGPDGLLKQLTKTVLETALNEELTEHLGFEKHEAPAAGAANIRNGTRSKTVLTDTSGPVAIEVPRDRAGTFTPLTLQHRDLMARGKDLHILVPIAHRQQAKHLEHVRHTQVGQSQQHSSPSRRTDRQLRPGPAPSNQANISDTPRRPSPGRTCFRQGHRWGADRRDGAGGAGGCRHVEQSAH